MKMITKSIAMLAFTAAALAAGYWWGTSRSITPATISPETTAPTPNILYYRNPMGYPDTSPVPKKDSMGMDYLPVYESEVPLSGNSVVVISSEKIQKLGVKTEVVTQRVLTRTIRAVASVQANEGRLHTITPKFEGWIQRLYVNTTGQTVSKGEALLDAYSPELITAQHEYLIARKGKHWIMNSSQEAQTSMQRLSENALDKLRNWDIADIDLQALQQEGRVIPHLTLRSAFSGVVIEKLAVQGKRFMPGEVLYQLADLSHVWVLADIFEQDLAMLHLGQTASIKIAAYPGEDFSGKVTFIYPTLTAETRTAKVRIALPNKHNLLKPAMYGSVEISTSPNQNKLLAVPNSAILDTGTRQLVLIARGAGQFEPRTITLGMQADGYTEVLSGLESGETVVISANFLIDAESNFNAALGSFSQPDAVSLPDANQTKSAMPAPAKHRGKGSIESIDWTSGVVTIDHGPIASLNWPAMLMDFHILEPALLHSLKLDQKIDFELIEVSAGEYVIERIHPADDSPVSNHDRAH